MINKFLVFIIKLLIRLRYRIKIQGIEEIAQKGNSGILFLPNHPALIEPIILVAWLYGKFKVRALADRNQIERFLIRRMARRIGVLPVSDISKNGISSAGQIREAITNCTNALRNGDNLVLYPAGRIYRSNQEDLGANSGVQRIFQELPDVRVVLVRSVGFWGSSYSWASGQEPSLGNVMKKAVKSLLLNGLFFSPRREISIELYEPEDLPRNEGRAAINSYLENFYNKIPQHNLYVPYTIWERGKTRTLPEAGMDGMVGDLSLAPPETRNIVTEYLQELTGCAELDDSSRLAHDLGMDSLTRADMAAWLQMEFGFTHDDPDALKTVGDVILAAAGEAVIQRQVTLKEVSANWFTHATAPLFADNLGEMTITEAFLEQARRNPRRVVIADQTSGVKTYRDLILAAMVLQKHISSLPGDNVGIMMPASVGAVILYMSVLFAGKTPVMVNWTVGSRNVKSSLDSVGVKHILTAQALLIRLTGQGIDLAPIEDRFICLEDIGKSITRSQKITALLLSYISWHRLRATKAKPSQTAVILFTSGSESQPKAVPLTHQNILANIADISKCADFYKSDSILGILPPFHSFGLTVSMILPLTAGIQAVYYPNPTEGTVLARIIDAYKVSIMIGTPTFLKGIVRTHHPEQLASLRLTVTGAEKCPDSLYQILKTQCPQTLVLEGYGVTECSPVISVNRQNDHLPGTIGKVMDSLDYRLINPESDTPVANGKKGILIVSGPSVFGGYLNTTASPFVDHEGKQWYSTGDLVRLNEQGHLVFEGRLKRFVKRGGEMISLPAIETVLQQQYPANDDDGPNLAVTPGPKEHESELVLFTTMDLKREEVNKIIRESGLSGLHNIRQVINIDEIPLLGTGKVDYRSLSSRIE